uniref:NB-ARC domain-containing protein n=1 Tax=Oryza barthii TaxID=65489 RepID=A0A0D3HAW2_9ORYZ
MKAFLLDLAREDPDNRKKHWMKQIRDMAYDCEDCIDDFAHRLPNDSLDAKCCPWIVTLVYDLWTFGPRREIASSIAELKVRAQLIADRRIRYGVENPNTQKGKGPPDATSYDIAEDQLASHELGMNEPVGMEKAMKDLEEWVDGTACQEPAVVSIVGFGGVGKTTITMALYKKVMYQFDCRAWVTVSQNYDLDAVLNDILKQIDPDYRQQCSSKTGTSENIKTLARFGSKLKRDVQRTGSLRQSSPRRWDGELERRRRIWPPLSAGVVGGARSARSECRWEGGGTERRSSGAGSDRRRAPVAGGKEREEEVASGLPTLSLPVEEVEKEVRGIEMGGGGRERYIILVDDIWSAKTWKTISDYLLLTDNKERSRIIVTSRFQANLLTVLGNISKGLEKISRKCLSRRWIAEGFVNAKQGLTAEEVAESYFNHILRRKLIRPVEHSSNGKLKTFQVHDMVLDYIVTKAREQNFITVVGGHLMMTAPKQQFQAWRFNKRQNLSQVRSLTVFGSLTQLPFHAFNDRIIQVLDFQGLKGFKNRHMKHICKMFVLKYLSLRGTDITHVPPTIVKLEYLETLDIRETRVEELPKEVEQLKLISRILGGSKNKNPRKGLRLPQEKSKKQQHKSMLTQDKEKEGMKALRILSGIKIDETTAVAGLHQLTGLKKLTIYKLKLNPEEPGTRKILTELRSSIEYLCSCGLQTLAINEEGQSNFINSLGNMSAPPRYLVALELSGMLKKPPGWIKTLRTLSKLTLSLTVLRTDTLEHLRALPLFSLTFSFSFGEMEKDQDKKMKDIIEDNKSLSDGEIFVPGEGFKSLKLLRFFAPLVPKLGFCHNAMPALEMIEMQFRAFEGLFGIDTLGNLKGVRLREAKPREEDKQTAQINDLLVRDLKDSTEGLKVIIDHTFTS